MTTNRNITVPCESVSTLYGLGNRPLSIGTYILDMKRLLRTKFPKNRSGIYQIKSEINGKIYVGSAINLKGRKLNHFSYLKRGEHENRHLQRHVNKHGLNVLKTSIIEFCPKEKLIEREQYYMDLLKPEFNMCPIAASNLGLKHSEETKKRNSESQKGKKLSEEHKQKIREGNIGVKRSEETKKRLSLANRGRKHTEETKQKMRELHIGKNNWNYGKHHSEETKRKISEGNKGNTNWVGRRHTEETKRKMRLSWLRVNYRI